MARKVLITEKMTTGNPNLRKVPHLYTIDQPVGLLFPDKLSPNVLADVALVQFMLYIWKYVTDTGIGSQPFGKGANRPPLTGKFDPVTLFWMLNMQNFHLQDPVSCSFDPIDPAFPAKPGGASMKRLNTVILDLRPDLFRDITKVPDCPTILIHPLRDTD
jgi:hypothetical protein